ncbi:hypothetical protein BDV95DRAFT_636150, partial [Massariosphaeria phaeospora]
MSRRENLEELVPWQSGPGPTDRGGFSIVWSCVAVIITCTWTTLHLNIPARTDSFWTKLLRKIKWMIVMIVLPEFIFSHAMHRHIKWTITHNYFLNMGGIVNSTNHLPIEPQYIKPIEGTLYDIAGSRQSGLSDIIHDNHITEAELLDKSKADYLVKVLWLIQIFRLVFEICTRATMKLPITPLEITAVSFSSLSLLTVLVQNKKPQDVGQP